MRSTTVASKNGEAYEVSMVHDKSLFRLLFGMKPFCESYIKINGEWKDSFTYDKATDSELERIYSAISGHERESKYNEQYSRLLRGQ